MIDVEGFYVNAVYRMARVKFLPGGRLGAVLASAYMTGELMYSELGDFS